MAATPAAELQTVSMIFKSLPCQSGTWLKCNMFCRSRWDWGESRMVFHESFDKTLKGQREVMCEHSEVLTALRMKREEKWQRMLSLISQSEHETDPGHPAITCEPK